MTDHGLLFKSELIRAFLAGRKTMTRRLVTRSTVVGVDGKRFSPAMWADLHFEGASNVMGPLSVPVTYRGRRGETKGVRVQVLPLWRVGDTVWARETWAAAGWPLVGVPARGEADILYRADLDPDRPVAPTDPSNRGGRWRSPIHMPRWASRLRFDVTSVRIERLQDITEEDARAEGVPDRCLHPPDEDPREVGYAGIGSFARDNFRSLWDSINRDRASWASNQWVVVIGLARRS